MSSTTRVKNMCGFIRLFYKIYVMPHDISVNQNICDSAFKFSPSWSYSLFKTHLNPYRENIEVIKNNVKRLL